MKTHSIATFVSALFATTIAFASSNASPPTHALALGAQPKYKLGFTHFDYANPKAPKGGTVRFGSTVAFDSLNPFTLKGVSASISNLVFEPLAYHALDESFSQYGFLAESMTLANDKLGITFRLRPEAKFSDGKPVTATDVCFSFEKLISKDGQPFYQSYFADVSSCNVLNEKTLEFKFKKINPELPLILTEVYVLPKHIYGQGNFTTDFAKKAVGSGPYLVKRFETGKILELERNPNYWAKNLNLNAGRFNFDQIVFKVYRDQTIWLEGLKAGEFDFALVNSSKQWAVDIAGDKWDRGLITKSNWKHGSNQGLQALIMNSRRPLFQTLKTRKAMALALDFDWMNKTLFYGQYVQASSFFNNSDLRASGLPSKAELKYLKPWKDKIPPQVFTEELKPIGAGLDLRQRLTEAKKLLAEDGWKSENGSLTRNGVKFQFTFLLDDPFWERIVEPYLGALKNLGIQGTIQTVDQSIFQRRTDEFDFDMMVYSFAQSQSPGNEQRDYWHSASADTKGSRNMLGIKSPAIDSIVEKLIAAPTRSELVTATHAMDRVLWFSHFLVPNWYIDHHRVTYWNKFGVPVKLPKYYAAQSYFMEYAWMQKTSK